MAKKKQQHREDISPPKQQPKHAPQKLSRQQRVIVGSILLITLICFWPVFNKEKEFTNWDDPVYVIDKQEPADPKPQPLITSTSFENIKKIFSTSNPVSLNYHPLTMLSLAYNYK